MGTRPVLPPLLACRHTSSAPRQCSRPSNHHQAKRAQTNQGARRTSAHPWPASNPSAVSSTVSPSTTLNSSPDAASYVYNTRTVGDEIRFRNQPSRSLSDRGPETSVLTRLTRQAITISRRHRRHLSLRRLPTELQITRRYQP